MKITELLKRFKETPGWWLIAVIILLVILKTHLIILSLPYLGLERFILTLLSLLTMYFLGAAVYRAYGNRFAVYLVPLILIIGGNYLNLSFKGVEINPLAAVWLALLYFSIFAFLEKDTLLHKVLIPGILCGLALAVNYSIYPIVLSPMLVILLYPGKQKLARVFLLIGVTLAVFLMLIPLSFALFVPFDMLGVGGVGGNSHYLIDWSLKGVVGKILAVVGLISAFKKDWKKTVIFVAFPLLPLVDALFAVFAALGILELYRIMRERMNIKMQQAAVTTVVLFCTGFPPHIPIMQWVKAKAEPDSRLRAVQWIRSHVPKGSTLVVPTELQMNISALQHDYLVYTREFKHFKENSFETMDALLRVPYFLVPGFSVPAGDGLTAKDLQLLEKFKEKFQAAVVFTGNKVLRNYYRPLPAGNPELAIGHMGLMKNETGLLTSGPGTWNGHAVPPQETSPALKIFFEKGKFVYNFTADEMGNILEVHSTAADGKGVRQVGFGFEAKQKGFTLEAPDNEGKYIYLAANASLSSHLVNEDNFMYISTQHGQAGGWAVEKQFFSTPGWQTYILGKKIQPGSTRLIMGFRFTPRGEEDRLYIRHIDVYISDKPM